jgi:hypothetical protein
MIRLVLFVFLNLSVAWSKDLATQPLVCASLFPAGSIALKQWDYYHIMTKDHRLISNARYLGPSSKKFSHHDFIDRDGKIQSVTFDAMKIAHPTGPGIPSKSWYNKFFQSNMTLQDQFKIFFDKPWFQNVEHTELEGHLLHSTRKIPQEAMTQFKKDLQTSLHILQDHHIQLPQIHFHIDYSPLRTVPHVYAYNGVDRSSRKTEKTFNIFWKIVWPLRHIQHHLSTLFHELFHLWISGQPVTPVLNEALADFMAAHFLNSPQISPGFWKDQRPVRDISTLESFYPSSIEKISKELPHDNLDYTPYHFPSMLISHLLWEARSTLDPMNQESMFQFIYQRIFHRYSEYKSLRTEYRQAAADSEYYYDLELICALLIQFSDQHLHPNLQDSFLKKVKTLSMDYHFDFALLRQMGSHFERTPPLLTDVH